MRFKVDENLPVDVAEFLRPNGHDAMTIFDQQMVGEPAVQCPETILFRDRCQSFAGHTGVSILTIDTYDESWPRH